MIPVLYDKNETSFTTNGIGRLVDAVSCVAIEGRNEVYECELQYPVNGALFNEITEGRVILCSHDETGDLQPFDIYHKTEPIDGIVTFYASHISYRLNEYTVMPFTASSCAQAFEKISSETVGTNPFTFWTNKTTAGTMEIKVPSGARGLLAGQEGSILDCFGSGEYEFDKMTVKLHQNRGGDTDVEIRYGKNLVDLENDVDYGESYNAVVPYWYGNNPEAESDVLVTLTEKSISSGHALPSGRTCTVPMDLSSEFEEIPTEAALRSLAQSKQGNDKGWQPKQTMRVNFVQLWQTEEYKEFAPLQRVKLCDTVMVYHPDYNIGARIKVIKVKYNVLLDRYDEMELGDPSATLAGIISAKTDASTNSAIAKESNKIKNLYEQAIAAATALITGAEGGYVTLVLNANGKPQEIVIADNEDLDQAVDVWRWNRNGIGYSSTGYNGTFTTAWTMDGHFNADFITTGHLLANLIKGGTLILGGSGNGNGVLEVKNSNSTTILTADNKGIYADYGGSHLRIDRSGTRGINYHETMGLYNGHEANAVALEGAELQYYHKHATADFNYENLDKSGWIHVNYDYQYGGYYMSFAAGNDSIFYIHSSGTWKIALTNNVQITGALYTLGSKSRLADTDDYGRRLLYCYETPTPMFGDIGEGIIGQDGKTYIFIDPIFVETIDDAQYQVFVQKYGEGDAYISERASAHFIVSGTPGLEFGWEIKAKQKGYSQRRLDDIDLQFTVDNTNYGEQAVEHLEQIARERS